MTEIQPRWTVEKARTVADGLEAAADLLSNLDARNEVMAIVDELWVLIQQATEGK